jgi:NADPH2:quinone reductase
MHAIQISETGGSDVLEFVELDDPVPSAGEVLIDVAATGVNFIDTYQRSGLYPMDLPFIPGPESAGTVSALGEGVDELSIGDRVAVAFRAGGYAERRTVPAAQCVPVPDEVPLDLAAASLLQGMTAHYLHTDTFRLRAGDRCLIHAGAGGTGRLLIQMAKRAGAEVFTTVGTEAKAELARSAGADHVILYSQVDFADEIQSISGVARPLDVVYDGVGKSVFDASLGLLRPRGLMATFGNASGPVDPVSPLTLSQNGSLFLTRPGLFDYISTREELERRVGDIFAWIASGELEIRIGETHPLADAATAQDRLEGRQTTGKLLLIP